MIRLTARLHSRLLQKSRYLLQCSRLHLKKRHWHPVSRNRYRRNKWSQRYIRLIKMHRCSSRLKKKTMKKRSIRCICRDIRRLAAVCCNIIMAWAMTLYMKIIDFTGNFVMLRVMAVYWPVLTGGLYRYKWSSIGS